MSENKTKTNKPSTLIYCGPSLKDVKQYDVFSQGLPDHVKKHFNNASVKALFVDIEELAKTRQNINTQGSRENQLYMNALKYSKGEK